MRESINVHFPKILVLYLRTYERTSDNLVSISTKSFKGLQNNRTADTFFSVYSEEVHRGSIHSSNHILFIPQMNQFRPCIKSYIIESYFVQIIKFIIQFLWSRERKPNRAIGLCRSFMANYEWRSNIQYVLEENIIFKCVF